MSSSQEMSFETISCFPDDLHVWLGKGRGKSLALGLSFWVRLCPRREQGWCSSPLYGRLRGAERGGQCLGMELGYGDSPADLCSPCL